jgi:hypothetical protein
MGQVVFSNKLVDSNIQTIDMSGKQGFYLLRVFGENGVYAKKFVMN